MSNEGIDRQQQKINEFLRLLPLTTAIAGLPDCELGRHFNGARWRSAARPSATPTRSPGSSFSKWPSKPPLCRGPGHDDRSSPPGWGSPPEPFGRYRLLKKLGQGGMGVVYLAHDPDLNRLVALKVPLESGGAEAAAALPAGRPRRRVAAPSEHLPLHEAGVIDGVPYLTMAYIDGTTLAERLRLGRRRPRRRRPWCRSWPWPWRRPTTAASIHRDREAVQHSASTGAANPS